MAVVNDYKCLAHGLFESRSGKCPHGCGKAMVEIVFLKAPGMVTGRTHNIDRTLQGLADDHGLSDMNNQGGTSSVFRHDPKMDKQQSQMQQQMLSGQTFSGAMAKDGVATTLAAGGYQADNALSNDVVKSMIQPPRPIVHGSYNPKDAK
jgi:hypothetical protein